MLRKSLIAACILGAALAGTLAGIGAAQTAPKPMTNDDVVAMIKGGLGESTIVGAIQSQETNFDVSAAALLRLKKTGVPSKIMDAMVSATGKRKAANEAAAAAAKNPVVPAAMTERIPPGQPAVLLVQGGQKHVIPMASALIVQTKVKPSTLGALASDVSLAQTMSASQSAAPPTGTPNGGAKLASMAMMANPVFAGAMMAGNVLRHTKTVTDVWAISGPKAETMSRNPRPSFEVHYDNIPGVNSDEYEPVLLELEPTPANFRLVGATEAKPDALQGSTGDWGMYSSFVEIRVPAEGKKVGPGSYQLQATMAMAPGEYGVALRPISKDKKFSGSGVGQNIGDGLLFNLVWAFEVPQ